MENVTITDHGGIVCDNPTCDYKDPAAGFDTFHEYLNKPCPKCGENLLTQEDYDNAMLVYKSIQYVNSLNEDQLKLMQEMFGIEPTGTEGESHLWHVKTHEGIEFNKVEKPDVEQS